MNPVILFYYDVGTFDRFVGHLKVNKKSQEERRLYNKIVRCFLAHAHANGNTP